MAVEIVNSGKDIKLDCVDPFDGRAEPGHGYRDVNYDEFLRVMAPVMHVVKTLRMASLEAATLYEDNSLDFVFVDATHTYDNVKLDIQAWLPKVKPGGLLTGHDYGGGVKQAVDELLPDRTITNDDLPHLCPVWVYNKPTV
jgi:hypothetical protein